jgi:hypothetical protein
MLAGTNGTVIVSAPPQPEPPVPGWVDEKGSKWIPVNSALQTKPFSKHALDAVFTNLEWSRLFADWNDTFA